MRVLLYLTFLSTIFYSCDDFNISNPGKDREVQGMKPVYIQFTTDAISSEGPKPIEKLENIVVYKEYILVVEALKGIHTIDNSDPENPTSASFWNIPGIRNFTIADDVLFVPITNRLLAIEINDIDNISLLSIKEEIFEDFDGNEFPEGFVGSFECIDTDKGIVIDWESAALFDPNCWR